MIFRFFAWVATGYLAFISFPSEACDYDTYMSYELRVLQSAQYQSSPDTLTVLFSDVTIYLPERFKKETRPSGGEHFYAPGSIFDFDGMTCNPPLWVAGLVFNGSRSECRFCDEEGMNSEPLGGTLVRSYENTRDKSFDMSMIKLDAEEGPSSYIC